jgi:hypothetical protein
VTEVPEGLWSAGDGRALGVGAGAEPPGVAGGASSGAVDALGGVANDGSAAAHCAGAAVLAGPDVAEAS